MNPPSPSPSCGGGSEPGGREEGEASLTAVWPGAGVGGVSSGDDKRRLMYTPARGAASAAPTLGPTFRAPARRAAAPLLFELDAEAHLRGLIIAGGAGRRRPSGRGCVVQNEVILPGRHRERAPPDGAG